jgi:hypothetical protein
MTEESKAGASKPSAAGKGKARTSKPSATGKSKARTSKPSAAGPDGPEREDAGAEEAGEHAVAEEAAEHAVEEAAEHAGAEEAAEHAVAEEAAEHDAVAPAEGAAEEAAEERRPLTDEERAELYKQQLKELRLLDVARDIMLTLVTVGYQKLGLTAETRELRDLGEAHLAIELLRGIIGAIEGVAAADEVETYRSTLAQMQMNYAKVSLES